MNTSRSITPNYIGGLGVDWCIAHHGICNEDERCCDMADDDDDCVLCELFYLAVAP